MIDFTGSAINVEGPFFTKDVTESIRHNLEDAVDELSKEGARIVRQNLRAGIHTWSGDTAAGVEGGALKRTQLLTGAEVGSIFGRVRMEPGMAPRGAGSARWPAARVPYIISAVLDGGGYAGHPRRPIGHFRKAATTMRRIARAIRADLTKGLE
jgi:hypothetical protein